MDSPFFFEHSTKGGVVLRMPVKKIDKQDRRRSRMAEGFEEDPAAAFLAREQDELAGIADDTLGFTTGGPAVSVLAGSQLGL